MRVLVALDVLIMAVMNGKRNETMSAAAWSLEKDGKWQGYLFRPMIDALFWLEPNHCAISWCNENPNPTASAVFLRPCHD